MKKLQLRFTTSEDKKHDLIVNYVKDGLDVATAQNAMNKISNSKIFSAKDVEIYSKPFGAKYVERTENKIF